MSPAASTPVPVEVDPFDLPDWLGTGEVTWRAEAGLSGWALPGALASGADSLPCDLLAVDEAYPAPVVDRATRTVAHQSWRHGQVHLVSYDGRLTVLVPGVDFTADRVLEALRRVAKALGAAPERYAVYLRVG